MARLRRLVVPGQVHHLVQRGHNAQPVFVDDEDRRLYLAALQDALRSQAVMLHAYALLDNQVQLLLRPPSEPALSRMMQALGRRYVALFNRRHGRSGTIWEGRFRAGVVQEGVHTLQGMLLVDALAARRGVVAVASRPAAGRARRTGWACAATRWSPTRRSSGAWATPRSSARRPTRRCWRRAWTSAQARRIEHAAASGWALGSPQFLADMAQQLGRPVRPRAEGPAAAPFRGA